MILYMIVCQQSSVFFCLRQPKIISIALSMLGVGCSKVTSTSLHILVTLKFTFHICFSGNQNVKVRPGSQVRAGCLLVTAAQLET